MESYIIKQSYCIVHAEVMPGQWLPVLFGGTVRGNSSEAFAIRQVVWRRLALATVVLDFRLLDVAAVILGDVMHNEPVGNPQYEEEPE